MEKSSKFPNVRLLLAILRKISNKNKNFYIKMFKSYYLVYFFQN